MLLASSGAKFAYIGKDQISTAMFINISPACHTELEPAVRAAVKTGYPTSLASDTSLGTK